MRDDLVKIHTTNEILKELENCIKKGKPFSTIRFGDAIFGILTSFLCPDVIDAGKWSGKKGVRMSNNILGQLTVPTPEREKICRRMVQAANRATYIDSYDAYKLIRWRRLGIVARRWKKIHEGCGITNDSYCSCFVHYFSIVRGEYNLFDIMKDRRVFIISSRIHIVDRLKQKSGAYLIDSYRVPRRGRRAKHYKEHFKKVMKLIKQNANNYDLFLIGAGFLGKIYCDQVSRFGGRAFDSGRLFDFWSGVRIIDSTPKRFIKYNPKTMLCDRIHTHQRGIGVW